MYRIYLSMCTISSVHNSSISCYYIFLYNFWMLIPHQCFRTINIAFSCQILIKLCIVYHFFKCFHIARTKDLLSFQLHRVQWEWVSIENRSGDGRMFRSIPTDQMACAMFLSPWSSMLFWLFLLVCHPLVLSLSICKGRVRSIVNTSDHFLLWINSFDHFGLQFFLPSDQLALSSSIWSVPIKIWSLSTPSHFIAHLFRSAQMSAPACRTAQMSGPSSRTGRRSALASASLRRHRSSPADRSPPHPQFPQRAVVPLVSGKGNTKDSLVPRDRMGAGPSRGRRATQQGRKRHLERTCKVVMAAPECITVCPGIQ